MALFETHDVKAGYGRSPVVHDVSLTVDEGQIAAIIGPNGAGKSTFIKAVFGLCDVLGGEIRLRGESIQGLRPSRIVAHGIGYVPQVLNVFPSLTVRENLEMGAYLRPAVAARRIDELCAMFPDLGQSLKRRAGVLSGGQRNMLALARALMMSPSLLLLDEPTAGLSPVYVDKVWEHIAQIRQSGVAILIVEQNARRALEAADWGYVLVGGRLAHAGTGAEILGSEEVVSLYLGSA
jgi:ABC-type branched-subunit amino acid transport system ATPase component